VYCGGRYLKAVDFHVGLIRKKSMDVKGEIMNLLSEFKSSVVSSLVDQDNQDNIHLYHGILQWLDEDAGVTEEIKGTKPYFMDNFAKKYSENALSKEECIYNFIHEYTPTAIVKQLDHAINSAYPSIKKELVIDWFKDFFPEDWQKEKYINILQKLDEIDSLEEKCALLENFDIVVPQDLQKDDNIDWKKIVMDKRKWDFLGSEVMDENSGKIKKGAILYMLETFQILKKDETDYFSSNK
jgi:hypothetical protein